MILDMEIEYQSGPAPMGDLDISLVKTLKYIEHTDAYLLEDV